MTITRVTVLILLPPVMAALQLKVLTGLPCHPFKGALHGLSEGYWFSPFHDTMTATRSPPRPILVHLLQICLLSCSNPVSVQ